MTATPVPSNVYERKSTAVRAKETVSPFDDIVVDINSQAALKHCSKLLAMTSVPHASMAVVEHESRPVTVLRLRKSRREYRVAIDLHDANTRFDLTHLARCDLYYKRCFDPAKVPTGWSHKVRPFGLNYFVSSSALRSAIFRLFLERPRSRGIQNWAREFYRHFRMCKARDYEYPPSNHGVNQILFQTRVWPQEEVEPDNAERLNSQRVSLIDALRKAFGPRFIGGLYPDRFARQNFPGYVTTSPSTQKSFIRWSRQIRLAIYTPGIFGSIAFKLPEYLASSKCIIATPLDNVLPHSLAPGTHLLTFRNADECLSHCDNALSNHAAAESLRNAAWTYYTRFVEPRAHFRWLLTDIAEALGV